MALARRHNEFHRMRCRLLLLVFPLVCLALGAPPSNGGLEARDTSANYSTPEIPWEVLKADTSAKAAGQNDFTCGPDKPCINGACCGEDGWCGYGKTYCGDGCQSNCDATAECGKFASDKGATCPLNVCCSEYGFCGTTHDFCKDGCQSNCRQPKPNGSPSNSQKRIIGYWEGWNSEKACGTMGIGEIPVQMLTHLIVAFAYISQDFKITNMDGLSSDVYRNAGNVKSRNPNVKVMIALGGWTFSDPGPWQSVFPNMTSTKENRATFIKNLMGFLGEYGYDGVDFDWEYPGADDRGGSKADAANYVALMKELREAIGDKDITVTFTAPTSYWYLRHFDVPGMVKYVDWINLMSYDLHGVWDSSNPIGNQVLSHTNLTEIDAALDLFWRVEVEPSSIVLGMGFYGRSFALEDASCWKPGCSFSGPGAAGRCSNTPGILSYREIQDIISDTGATAYLDKDAQARYMVYSGNNWISFDDEKTFQAKIDYANKIGLSGLMVWAVDLDDGKHTALSAISDSKYLGGGNIPFSLVDLDRIFPEALRPAKDSNPDYGLVTFGGSGSGSDVDPKGSPFGLFVAGDGPAATKLRKRHGQREPFTFLDCPSQVLDKPHNYTHTARVACFNEDVDGCFQLLQRGVENTLVEMPDECAPGKLARAISLDVSSEQDFPFEYDRKRATSEIYDFTFDFDVSHAKRDEKGTSIRVDYSNANGYWSSAVDSPGVESKALSRRHYSDDLYDWRDVFDPVNMDFLEQGAATVREDVSVPVYWELTPGYCYVNGDKYTEGIAVYVEGDFDVNMWYGFSMVGSDLDSELNVEEANGFLKIDGKSDLTLGIGGVGALDSENMSASKPKRFNMDGHRISGTKATGEIYFQPWYEVGYHVTTYSGEDNGSSGRNKPVGFNGNASVRVRTDFGDFETTYPDPKQDQTNTVKPSNRAEVSSEGHLYSTYGTGGGIYVEFLLRFGLDVNYIREDGSSVNLPTLITTSNVGVAFKNHPEDDSDDARACLEIETFTSIQQSSKNGDSAGWEDSNNYISLGQDRETTGKKCYENLEEKTSKRSLLELSSPNTALDLVPSGHVDSGMSLLAPRAGKGRPGFNYGAGKIVSPDLFIGLAASVFKDNDLDRNIVECDDYSCMGCTGDESDPDVCCGCTSMMELYRFDDLPPCDSCQEDDGEWPFGKGSSTESSLLPRKSGVATMSPKKVSVCDFKNLAAPFNYPAFPSISKFPWDGIQKGKWDSISRYWGNTSADCTDWSVDNRNVADTEYLRSGAYARAAYQTEHVFEGQLIGDFFTYWLDQGKVKNQSPPPANAQQIHDCDWTQKHILDDNIWEDKNFNANITFINYLLMELGSEISTDRLAIYKSRPNRMKGNLFSGVKTISTPTYNKQSTADQLQRVKEFGMAFEYMNDPEIWEMFCDTYEGIYEKMVEFDGRYNGTSDLQSEWKAYIKETLSSIVNRSKDDFDMYYQFRKAQSPNDKPFYDMWQLNLVQNRPLIKLDGKCKYWD